MAKQVDDKKTTDLFSAKSKNATRQAAFKEKMKSSGKRQVVFWLDSYQEKAIKELLGNTT